MATIWQGSLAPGIGRSLGTGIAKSLQSGLDLLAQSKMDEINQERNRREDERVSQLFMQGGHEEPTARILAELLRKEPKSIFDVLKTLGSGGMAETAQGQGNGPSGIPGQGLGMQAEPDQLPEQQPNQNQNPNQNLLDLFRQAGMQGGGMGLQGAFGAPQGAQGLASLQPPVQQQQAAQQVPVPVERKSLAAPKNPSFAQAFAQAPAKQKEKSAAEQAHSDAISAQYHNLADTIETTNNILETLKSPNLKTGPLQALGANIAPAWLSNESESLDKNAAKLINLTSQDLKGVPSVFRVKLLEKGKPGVQHSIPVNKEIAEDARRQAKSKLLALKKRYPDIVKDAEESRSEAGFGQQAAGEGQFADISQFPPASKVPGGIMDDENGNPAFRSDGKNWIPV